MPSLTYAERLGIPPPDLDHLAGRGFNMGRLFAFAVLEAGRPCTLDELAARLRAAGVESPIGDLPQSMLKAWRGRPPVRRDDDGRFLLELRDTYELRDVLRDLGHADAVARIRAASERAGPTIVIRPLFTRRGTLVALGGVEARERAEPWAMFGQGFEAAARAQLEPAGAVVGPDARRALEALDLDPDARPTIELSPPKKTRRLNASGRTLKITLELLMKGSIGVSKPLEDPKKLLAHLEGSADRKLVRRLSADVKNLLALYRYAVMQGHLRLRWGFLDEAISAEGWGRPGDLHLFDLLRRSRDEGLRVEIVSGPAPGHADPWAHGVRGRVHALEAWRIGLEAEDGERFVVARDDVQAARLLDAADQEIARAGPVLPPTTPPEGAPALSASDAPRTTPEPAPDDEGPPPQAALDDARPAPSAPPGRPDDDGPSIGRSAQASLHLGLQLTPSGHLRLTAGPSTDPAAPEPVARALREAFATSEAAGLLALVPHATDARASASLGFGLALAQDVLHAACLLPEAGATADMVRAARPADEIVRARVEGAPPMRGGERLDADVVRAAHARLAGHLGDRVAEVGSLAAALEAVGGDWHAKGRVWLHLAENKGDEARPFAFLATFTHVGGGAERVLHTPLAAALELYRGDRDMLLRLLAPVERAAARSPWFGELLESRQIFNPLAWTAEEAHAFLEASEQLEGTGVMIRLPKKWRTGPRPSPRVNVRIGEVGGSLSGDALLDFDARLALDGEPLTADEAARLLEGVPRLEFLRGQWVDVDPVALRETLDRWQGVADDGPTSVAEGLRLLAGLEDEDVDRWTDVEPGAWLAGVLERLREPGFGAPSRKLQAELRPYQKEGLAWLATVFELGIGGCLADDMGLGKTLQVIALLVRLRDEGIEGPSLLVIPASLIGNWKSELTRFAPHLEVLVAHRSEHDKAGLAEALDAIDEADVVITTYATLGRLKPLQERRYPLVVLDEAQAIKNSATAQARHARALSARAKVALTGTPIENRLSDLWSLFGFLNPGLLGSQKDFKALVARANKPGGPGYAPLRRLVQPYLLRRLKTDKRIISDLPDKTEVNTYCGLTKQQAALYQDAVEVLARALATADRDTRQGVVLASLTRFKQICNHPSHWLQDGKWRVGDSGKTKQLLELARTLEERQEKVLVFTQYREMTGPLAALLEQAFGEPGLVLHGGTTVKKRQALVERFAAEDGPPFFVLSLKAGGSGLNLTAASHVVHFDRWWNPAVENQATDRAYRIGQHKNVLVHRFVCRGTLEERIDHLIEAKRGLAQEVLSGDGAPALNELSDEQLLDVVRLDRSAALDAREA